VVESASILDKKPGFARQSRRISPAKKAGLAYERKVQDYLGNLFGDFYLPGIWFSFYAGGYAGRRYAQPDGLLFDLERGVITIVEVKIRHTTRAWWQLRELYQPLVEFKFPDWGVEVVEVFNYFDKKEAVPEKVMHVGEVDLPTQVYKMKKLML